jgi:hypothetical protein
MVNISSSSLTGFKPPECHAMANELKFNGSFGTTMQASPMIATEKCNIKFMDIIPEISLQVPILPLIFQMLD